MEEIAYHHSRKDMWKMILAGAVMFGASLLLLYLGLFTDFRLASMGPATGPFSVIVGTIGSIFFGYGFFYIMRIYLFPKNALVITDTGIINHTNAIGSKEVIPFTDMKKAELEIINATPHVGITLYDDEKYFNGLSFFKRKAAEMNKKYFGTSAVSMSVPHEKREELHEIVDIINERIEMTQDRKQITN